MLEYVRLVEAAIRYSRARLERWATRVHGARACRSAAATLRRRARAGGGPHETAGRAVETHDRRRGAVTARAAAERPLGAGRSARHQAARQARADRGRRLRGKGNQDRANHRRSGARRATQPARPLVPETWGCQRRRSMAGGQAGQRTCPTRCCSVESVSTTGCYFVPMRMPWKSLTWWRARAS